MLEESVGSKQSKDDTEEELENEAPISKKSNDKKKAEVGEEKSSSKKKNIKQEDDPNGTDFEAPKSGAPFPGEMDA